MLSRKMIGIVIGGAVLFLLFFHVVPSAMVVFPKEHASFVDTFIGIDEYVQRFNSAGIDVRLGMSQSHLHRELVSRGLIEKQNRLGD